MGYPLELHIVVASPGEDPSIGFYPVSARLTGPSERGVLTASGRLSADDLQAVAVEWEASLPQADPAVRTARDTATGRELSDLLFTEEMDHLFAVAREDVLASSELFHVKLEVESPEAHRAPWELLLLRFAERGLPVGLPHSRVKFLRYTREPARPADAPLALPINALVVTPGPWFELLPQHDFDLRALLETQFPHLKDTLPQRGLLPGKTRVSGLAEFIAAVDRNGVDVLHLVLPADRDARGQGAVRVGPNRTADLLPVSVLDGLLHAAGTRLLVLHDPTPDGSAAPALWQVAGGIIRAGGPPTLVARFPHTPQGVHDCFEYLYQDIIHAEGINVSSQRFWLEARHGPSARNWLAFFSSEGGEETLLLSQILGQLKADADEQKAAVDELVARSTSLRQQMEALMMHAPEPPPPPWRPVPRDRASKPVEDARKQIGEYAEHVRAVLLDYSGETRGLLPLADEQDQVPRVRAVRAEAEMAVEELHREVEEEAAHREVRYLNTHFARSRPDPGDTGDRRDDPVAAESTLKYGRTYYLEVDIRADRTGSHADDEIEWPDSQLPDRELAKAQGGRSLRVALFSRDFTLVDDQKPLWLPNYGPTERLYFQVVAPRQLRPAQIRVCVYYKNNLVQSRMVYAQIDRGERTDSERGNWSEVEYTLSATYGDLDRLRPRGLNIVVNQSRDGTHALLVRGDGLKDNVFDLRDEMTLAVSEFREALNRVMFKEHTEVYRLDRKRGEGNWGTDGTLTVDLRRLARVGSKWYRDLFGAEKRELMETLQERLEAPTTIQIIRAKGKHIFPWSIIYDLPLVRSTRNQVCLAFRDHRTPEGILDYRTCKETCPHLDRTESPPRHDTNVVCPFGFWGIKHVVEQPLSASIKLAEEDGQENRRPSSVSTVIEYEGRPMLRVGISLELALVQQHVKALQDWIRREGTLQPFDPDRTLETVGTGLQSSPLHIYYFYCHGGKRDGEVWLRVGDGEYILPDHIRSGWELRRIWRRSQPPFVPLVFLNGCGTVSLSPDSIADFLHEFAFAEASGVIGTEISVPERLAQEVGLQFLQAFAGRGEAGHIIQELRHKLLLKYNPLGLVYTPYCYAELQLKPR